MLWYSGVLGMANKVVAAATFSRFWFPSVPLWRFVGICHRHDTGKPSPLRKLSRIEGVLVSVKVAALVIFLMFGGLYLLGIFFPFVRAADQPAVSIDGNLFPNGVKGVLAPMVMFSYIGTGIIGLAIADTDDPAKAAPAAIPYFCCIDTKKCERSLLF